MKYFIVLGTLTSKEPVDEQLMEQHIIHSRKAIESGMILLSGLQENFHGGILLMKGNSREEIEAYFESEPLRKHGLQKYEITEFTPHFISQSIGEWNHQK